MNNAPCKGCGRRRVGCHGVCEDYKAFRAVKDAENAVDERRRKAYNAYYGYKSEVVERYYRERWRDKRR